MNGGPVDYLSRIWYRTYLTYCINVFYRWRGFSNNDETWRIWINGPCLSNRFPFSPTKQIWKTQARRLKPTDSLKQNVQPDSTEARTFFFFTETQMRVGDTLKMFNGSIPLVVNGTSIRLLLDLLRWNGDLCFLLDWGFTNSKQFNIAGNKNFCFYWNSKLAMVWKVLKSILLCQFSAFLFRH